MPQRPSVLIEDLGQMPYQKAWQYQTEIHQQLIAQKRQNRDQSEGEREPQQHRLLLCEHPPVYTLGKSGSMNHLLVPEEELEKQGTQFFKINRGGDITFHGPGQIVGYPIFDMDEFFTDVHRYVRCLEQVIIDVLLEYDLVGIRIKDYTGVWLDQTDDKPLRKICAIGVHMSRWVTLHGFAFNINTDLGFFQQIVPCGISEERMTVTSLADEFGVQFDLEEVKQKLIEHFAKIFDFNPIY